MGTAALESQDFEGSESEEQRFVKDSRLTASCSRGDLVTGLGCGLPRRVGQKLSKPEDSFSCVNRQSYAEAKAISRHAAGLGENSPGCPV